MPELRVYDERTNKRIEASVLAFERKPRDRQIPQPIGVASSIEWLPFKNTYSGTIPAYACMKVTGGTDPATETGGTAAPRSLMLKCTQPDTTFTTYAFNGSQDVPQNGYGLCHRSRVHCQVLYDTGTPAPGESWGVKAGQFSLTKRGRGMFVVDYPNDTTTKIMCGYWHAIGGAFICQLSSDCPGLSSGTPGSQSATIWAFDGTSLSSTSITTTVYNSTKSVVKKLLSDNSTVKFVQCKYIDGYPFIDVDDCF